MQGEEGEGEEGVEMRLCYVCGSEDYVLFHSQKGFGVVLKYDPSLCILAYCLDSQSAKIKILILKVRTGGK